MYLRLTKQLKYLLLLGLLIITLTSVIGHGASAGGGDAGATGAA